MMDTSEAERSMKIDLKLILKLYRKYSEELKQLRKDQRKLYSPEFLSQFNDEEAEITYLLIRETKPRTLVEISPCRGWSTSWILRALDANENGTCYSYELLEENMKWAKRNIPERLQLRWKCFTGRVQNGLQDIPSRIDYLFLDSDHSRSFARWYISNLFPKVQGIVSVHDVFHIETWGEPSEEGKEVIKWLGDHNVDFFSSSLPFLYTYREVEKVRKEIGCEAPIHKRACGGARLLGCLVAIPTTKSYANLPRAVINSIMHILGGGLDRLHCNPAIFFYLDTTHS